MKTKPTITNRMYRRGFRFFREATSSFRMTPNFIIGGSPRCGTTSLYNYLIQHPKIMSSIWKEVGFFDLNYNKGMNWYKSHFPINLKNIKDVITGEATPSYIFNSKTPSRILENIPDVKIIFLLRNPVDRAYSHYQNAKRLGRENRGFEEVIEKQILEISNFENNDQFEDENNFTKLYHTTSYLTRGIYYHQIKNWKSIIPSKQLLILKSEDMYNNPTKIYQEVLEFLKVPKIQLQKYTKFNFLAQKNKMKSSQREKLIEYFKPHNRKLYDFLNRDFEWDN